MSEELNKKLAEWAGIPLSPIDFGVPCTEGGYDPPNFTESLDACFKWLVPKLNDSGYGIYKFTQYSFHSFGVELGALTYQGTINRYMDGICAAVAREPALALCLVIEKLIDFLRDDEHYTS